MKLYTKQNCPSCEMVKEFMKTNSITQVEVKDLTNDLVTLQNVRNRLEVQGMNISFPVLELKDGELINPSERIRDFLQEQFLTNTA